MILTNKLKFPIIIETLKLFHFPSAKLFNQTDKVIMCIAFSKKFQYFKSNYLLMQFIRICPSLRFLQIPQ